MKKVIPSLIAVVAVIAICSGGVGSAQAAEPTVTIDLYGNVFLNGSNTSRQIGDFARDPANAALVPQIDAAVRDAATVARARIAADVKAAQDDATAAIAANAADLATKAARIAALEQHIAALNVYIAGLRGQLAGLGAQSTPPPSAP